MKAKRVTKIARGRRARSLVFRGSKERTVGGIKADGLMRNKRGKIVSKRASASGKRKFKSIEDWIEAIVEARQKLHVKGFLAINGRTLQGKALYVKARAIREERRRSRSTSSASVMSPSRASAAFSPARLAA